MKPDLRVVTTSRQLREFIHLPGKIHKGHSTWLPPIYLDERNFFNPKKNIAFKNCDTRMLLAYRDNKPVGRIMGIIHNYYNELHQIRDARFGYLETWDDAEVVHALMTDIEEWARAKGMERLIGPYGFSDKDVQGLLIDGFEHMPVLDSACNYKYMVDLVEWEGFTKEIDCHIFRYELNGHEPENYKEIYNRIVSRNGYELKEFTTRKELKPFILPVLRLVNETYTDLYGFVPMEEKEMSELAKRYLPVLDPRYVKVVLHKGNPVAFLVGIPNFTPGLQKSRGRLFPLGIFHLLRAMKKSKQLDLMLGAVLPRYQNRGLEIFMAVKLFESCRQAGLEQMEVHLVLETNTRMLAELEKIHAIPHKKFRVYQKRL